MLFIVALAIGAFGGIFTALGKSANSTPLQFVGAGAMLIAGGLFFANAFI